MALELDERLKPVSLEQPVPMPEGKGMLMFPHFVRQLGSGDILVLVTVRQVKDTVYIRLNI